MAQGVAQHKLRVRRDELARTLTEINALVAAYRTDGTPEHRKHAMRQQLGIIAARLVRPHFQVASNVELLQLMSAACIDDASGAAHLVSNALRILGQERVGVMPPSECAKIALFITKHKASLPIADASHVCTAAIGRLLAMDVSEVGKMPLDRAVALLDASRTSELVPEGYALELLKQLLIVLPLKKHEVEPWHVAIVCQAVCWHRFADKLAVDFFADSVDLCIAQVDGLSARDASFILDAYATVGYPHLKLFLTLGQHVGDMGEDLVDADAARVIRAFEKTDLKFDNLRHALQSALRLKRIFKPISHSRGRMTKRRGAGQ